MQRQNGLVPTREEELGVDYAKKICRKFRFSCFADQNKLKTS